MFLEETDVGFVETTEEKREEREKTIRERSDGEEGSCGVGTEVRLDENSLLEQTVSF